MINISRIYESIISEGKHWPEDYIKTGFNMIKSSELGNQSWYDDNYIRQDLKTIADEFGPLSHKNSNLGYFSPIIRWFIEFSGKDKSKYQEFIERKLDKIIQGLQLIVNDASLEGKWKDKIKNGLPFEEFEKIIDSELEKISQKDASKRGKTYGKSDYELIPINSYEELHEKFGGDKTGYKRKSEWCHTNGKSTYDSWTSNGTKAFFVLAKKDWEKIEPPDPETTNAYDEYGTSLIAILVDVSSNDLLNATLRWNHVIEPSQTRPRTTVDKAFLGWGDLNETIQMNVEKEVEEILKRQKLDLQKKVEEANKKVEELFSGKNTINENTIPNEYRKLITEIKIPDSVTSIGNWTFDDCTSLKSVIIGNRVMIIGDYAFSDCSGLTSVTIPGSVTSIGRGAFLRCIGLTSITIPTSVTSIGENAFSGCTGLTSVTIPGSVTSIESYAFRDCSGLTSVTIPDSVTSIGHGVFSYCTGLTSVTISNSVKTIGGEAFNGCTGLTSVTIPDFVTSIGDAAFYNCINLISVTIPSSVKNIEVWAFKKCPNLTITFQKGFDRTILDKDAFDPSCKFIFED